MSLEGRVAIVTASAGAGIGQAVIRRFAREGASVVVTDAHEKRTGEVAEALKSEGYKAIGIVCDVTNRDQVDSMVQQTLSEFGRIDILVNNAGTQRIQPVHELTDENWWLTINTCLTSTFYCTRAVLPTMMKQNYGRIVNISSVAAWGAARDGSAPYAAAKAAIMAFTRCVAAETAKYNIAANVIAPGYVPNPFMSRLYSQEALDRMATENPRGRGITPEEITYVVMFLVSEENAYMSGEIIAVTCGSGSR